LVKAIGSSSASEFLSQASESASEYRDNNNDNDDDDNEDSKKNSAGANALPLAITSLVGIGAALVFAL